VREFEVKLQTKCVVVDRRRRLLLYRLEIRRGMLETGREGDRLSRRKRNRIPMISRRHRHA